MAQTGYTPILIYASGTTTNVPLNTNLTSTSAGAELALNYADGKLFYKDSSNVVQVLATKGTGPIGGSTTQVQYNNAGVLAGSANLTFDGTNLTSGGTITGTKLIPTGTSVAGNGLYLPAANALGLSTNGTNAVYIDSSQNVGIGTSSPSSYGLLTVLSSTAGSAKISIQDTSGGASPAPLLQFGVTSSNGFNTADAARIWTTSPSSSTAALNFAAYSGGAPSTAQMTLTGGNVGIGTVSPTNKLDVSAATGVINISSTTGTNHVKLQVNNTSGSFQLGIENSAGSNYGVTAYSRVLWNDGAYPTVFFTNSIERMRITSAGGLAVGTTSDPGAGSIYATGNITAYFSDDRLKTRFGNIQNALDKVKSLDGFYYEANQTAQDLGYKPVREAGVSAQQVQAILPEVVKPAPIDQQYLTVDYERLVPLLIEAIKELNGKVETLEAKLKEV